MRRCLTIATFGTAICLLMASGASASYEFGNRCTSNAAGAGGTVLGLSNGVMDGSFSNNSGPWEQLELPAKVITGWKVQVGPSLSPPPQQLVAWRYSGEDSARIVGESAIETLHEGANGFATRIPIPEYTHIGISGPSGSLYCDGAENSFIGFVEGNLPVGSSRGFETQYPRGAPVVAIAEPDNDSDGYGDATQDQCISQEWTHGPCEYFGVLIPQRWATKGALWLELAATMSGSAVVSATINLPGRNGPRTVKVAPVSVAVSPQATVTTSLTIPRRVRRFLAKFPRTRGVRVELDVVAISEHGNEARSVRRFKVNGRKRRRQPGV